MTMTATRPIRVKLTVQQIDALIGACVDADSVGEDAREESGEYGNRARAEKRLRDRAVRELLVAKRLYS